MSHSCCMSHTHENDSGLSRRSFMKSSAGLAAAASMIGTTAAAAESETPPWYVEDWNPDNRFLVWGKPLRVQPILVYAVYQPKKEASWKSWGGVLTEESAAKEVDRISRELTALSQRVEFPIEILPLVKVKTPEEAVSALKNQFDVVLVYAAAGASKLLEACVPPQGDALIFVRHRSGPVYYWYEGLSVAFLKTDNESLNRGAPTRLGNTHVDDVVVDDYDEVLWRLRALYGIKNFIGSRIVALGGVWGKYASDAPQIAKDKYKLEIIEIGYDEIARRFQSAVSDSRKAEKVEQWTNLYLSLPNTALKTDRPFVVNAFHLYSIFKDLMRENQAPAFTIKDCMSAIMPISKTTACLPLSLMNDDGLIAFCESDFVVIPAGILMRHIVGAPVFLHNSTFPHKGMVTCAHCTGPRRMDGKRYEPTLLVTHLESEFGAAPKVEMPIGQEVSFIDPAYTTGRWVGMCGTVERNPFYEICRSQQDVRIQGNWKKLLNEVRDSHWLMAYGNHLNEIGYAARKIGVRWENISEV